MLWVGNRDIQVGDKTVKLLLSVCCLKFYLVFSVTRRSRSDSVTESLSESVTLRTELTDVTLVSEDTY